MSFNDDDMYYMLEKNRDTTQEEYIDPFDFPFSDIKQEGNNE